MTGGDGEGTMKVETDGFGELHYTFTPDSGTAVNGDAAYYYLGTYTSGETGYGIFYFTVGTGESAHRYTVRFETEGTGVQLIGSEAGVYSELNPDSPYTARLFLHGDGTAAMYFLMASQSYSPLLEGTYQADGETGNYRFTATSYAENYEESLSVYYADFTFRLYADRAQFSVSDGVDGTYTFSDGDSEWTIVCNGFGYATLTQAGSATGSQVPYELHEGYGTIVSFSSAFLRFSGLINITSALRRERLPGNFTPPDSWASIPIWATGFPAIPNRCSFIRRARGDQRTVRRRIYSRGGGQLCAGRDRRPVYLYGFGGS